MTVRSGRLDFTLSAHLMSVSSGSHCKRMSESPRHFSIFIHHVTANVSVAPFVSTTVDVPYPNDFHIHAQNFQSVGRCSVFQNKEALNDGKFAVFDDTLHL